MRAFATNHWPSRVKGRYAKVFLEAGARTDLKRLDGRTPLEMAREYGYSEIAELIEARASPSEKAASSRTSDEPIHQDDT